MIYLIIFCAKYLYLIAIFIAVLFWININRKAQFFILKFTLINLPISFILGKTANFIFFNPRPFVTEKITPLIAHAADNGFPSDHTLLVATIAMSIFSCNKKLGIVLLILAFVVGLSRVIAKIHHPLDIIGSLIIPFIAFYFSGFLLNKSKLVKLFLNRLLLKLKYFKNLD